MAAMAAHPMYQWQSRQTTMSSASVIPRASSYTSPARCTLTSSCSRPHTANSTSSVRRSSVLVHAESRNTQRPSSAREARGELWQVLLEQARRESLPWIQDLLLPLLDGPPQPLKDTRPPHELADPDSAFITVDGIRLHYKELAVGQVGPGSPTLLLVHGFNGSLFNWGMVAQDIADQVAARCGSCRVISYDRPPFGLSQRPLEWPEGDEGPYTQAAGAQLGVGLLRALGAGPALVVGHSQGASVAVDIAARYPQLVSGLALIAPAVPTSPKGFLARSDLGQLLRLAVTRAVLASEGPGINYVRRLIYKRRDEVLQGNLGIYYDETSVDPQAVEGYLRPMSADDWDRGFLLMSRGFGVVADPPDLTCLAPPALVLVGGQDTTTPPSLATAVAERLRERPGCSTRYVQLECCGHIPMEELPARFTEELVDFACSEVAWAAAGTAAGSGIGAAGGSADASAQ